MAKYSLKSKQKLDTVHPDLQTIFNYVIQVKDNSVIFGLRTAEEQFELYKKGRELIDGEWTITEEKKVVTHKDGFMAQSYHQSGMAIDVVPWPGMWQAEEREFFELAGVVKATAYLLKKYGAIKKELQWGYDLWGWDLAHFQLKR